MWPLKTVHKWFAGILLLATLVSFSGVSSVATNFTKTQTELVSNSNLFDITSVLYYDDVFNSSQNIIYNQYTVFNFSCFLIRHHFDFSITFKIQKEAVLQFKDFNSILQQNLIAQEHSNDSH